MVSKMTPECILQHKNVCSNAIRPKSCHYIKNQADKRGKGLTTGVRAALVRAAYSSPSDYVQSVCCQYFHPSPSGAHSQLIHLLPVTARAHVTCEGQVSQRWGLFEVLGIPQFSWHAQCCLSEHFSQLPSSPVGQKRSTDGTSYRLASAAYSLSL